MSEENRIDPNALTDEDLMMSSPPDEEYVREVEEKQEQLPPEQKKRYLTEEDMLRLSLYFEKRKYTDFRMEDLKSQIKVKQDQLEVIKQEIVDDVWRLKNDLEALEEGLDKLLKKEALENQEKDKLIISLAKKHNLPEAYLRGRKWYFNEDSGEIILK
jgi:hypothetical protein